MSSRNARATGGPSVRPALIVVGVAVVIVAVFGVGSVIHGSSPPAHHAVVSVHGSPIPSEPAARALHPIEIPGAPPADVLSALVLPSGASEVSTTPWDKTTQYSASMAFELDRSQAKIIDFYRVQLAARGWSLQGAGPARDQRDSVEVLGQRASSDGWYWEVGVTVSPTTFTSSKPETTRFSIGLFQKTDLT
ncbi:MAG: hypothetical protein ACRDV8_00295 [Acidimicrobiales bacterium]